jgi:RNA polymerase sigma-70 factor (ECF subfamily)
MNGSKMEAKLTPGIRESDETAFLAAYRLYHAKLYGYFLKKTKSVEVSEELVQLAFIKLWRSRRHLREDLPLSQQLFRIAKTTLIDLLRRKAALREVPLQDIAQADMAEAAPAPDSYRLTLVRESLSQLPPMRKKIMAFRLEGLSNQEIAETLSISKKTVENQLNRAVREIRKMHPLLLLVAALDQLVN